MKKRNFIYTLLLAFFVLSCVPQRKYDDLQASKNQADAEIERLLLVEEKCEKLQENYARLQEDYEKEKMENENLAKKYSNLSAAQDDLMRKYDRLLDQNTSMLNASSEEKQQLIQQLSNKEQELDRKERQLRELEEQLGSRKNKLDELRTDLTEREKKIDEMSRLLNSQREAMDNLRNKVNKALAGFTSDELTVTQKNGRIYVSLSQNLLFETGSDRIDPKGRDAVKKLSEVLTANPHLGITVEGHTDTQGSAERNWDLSVARATSVVKLLTDNGVKPKNLVASGRAYYAPVASNETAEGRSQNRRVEIIISPDLEELYSAIRETK